MKPPCTHNQDTPRPSVDSKCSAKLVSAWDGQQKLVNQTYFIMITLVGMCATCTSSLFLHAYCCKHQKGDRFSSLPWCMYSVNC